MNAKDVICHIYQTLPYAALTPKKWRSALAGGSLTEYQALLILLMETRRIGAPWSELLPLGDPILPLMEAAWSGESAYFYYQQLRKVHKRRNRYKNALRRWLPIDIKVTRLMIMCEYLDFLAVREGMKITREEHDARLLQEFNIIWDRTGNHIIG